MKKVVIYNRVSTKMQEESKSLESQIDQCKEHCKRKNYNVLQVISDVESGTKSDRVGFLKLKKLIETKSFDTLVVYEVSRLSRKLIDLLLFIEELNNNNIEFFSVTEPDFDTTTNTGKLNMNIRLSLIQYERDTISTRVTNRMYYQANKGRWLSGKPPLGYDLENKKLIPNEKAEVIKDIFERFISGESMYSICKLHDLKWGSTYIRRILTNPAYYGAIRYGARKTSNPNKEAILTEDCHEPLISKDVFLRAKELLKTARYQKPRDKKFFLLEGLIKCGYCGHNYKPMRGRAYEKTTYYGCHFKRLKYSDPHTYRSLEICTASNVKGSIIEKFVLEELEKIINTLDIEDIESNKDKEDEFLRSRILKLKSQKSKLLDLYLDERLPEKEYKERDSKVDGEIYDFERKLLNSKPKKDHIKAKEVLKKYFHSIDLKNVEEANSILKIIIDKIVVKKEKDSSWDDFEVELYLNIL